MATFDVFCEDEDGSKSYAGTYAARSAQSAIDMYCDDARINDTYVTAEPSTRPGARNRRTAGARIEFSGPADTFVTWDALDVYCAAPGRSHSVSELKTFGTREDADAYARAQCGC